MAYLSANATVSAHGAVAVTPSDATNITGGVCRALYVGVGGNITAVMADGQVVLFTAVPNGIFPIQVSRVNSTGTTATSIVALF